MKINSSNRLMASSYGFRDFRSSGYGEYYFSPYDNKIIVPGYLYNSETYEGASPETEFRVSWEFLVIKNNDKYGGYKLSSLKLEDGGEGDLEYREFFKITKPLLILPAEIEDIAFRCKRLEKILSNRSLDMLEDVLGIKVDDDKLPRVYNDGWY